MTNGIYKKVTIKQTFKTPGFAGTATETTFFEGYAYCQKGQGREYFAALQRHADLSVLAQLTQYVRGLDATMTVYIDGQPYNIIGVPIGVRELNITELKLKLVK